MKQPFTTTPGDNQSADAENVWNFAGLSCKGQAIVLAICGTGSAVQLHCAIEELGFISKHSNQLHCEHSAGRTFYELG